MARVAARPAALMEQVLEPAQQACWQCGQPMWVAYHSRRTVVTLDGLLALRLAVRRCETPSCASFHRAYRPEAEGRLALPQAEFGLDVIALVGQLRFAECRSVPEIHRALVGRGVAIAERSVTNLLARYEELVALALADAPARAETLRAQGAIVLALDGLQPDVGHEVLWVLRDVLSGTILLARSLLGATQPELVTLLREVVGALPTGVTVRGVVSDGQHSIRRAVRRALPGVPHQLCQFHYLREAARPIFEADRHAKKELKKRVRGVRPIERALEERTDAAAEALRGYCLAVRSAITDDGRPPLAAPGLTLQARLTAIQTSLTHVAATVTKKGGTPAPALTRLHALLTRGLAATAALWPDVRRAYGWVHQAAHVLGNDDGASGPTVRRRLAALLGAMARWEPAAGTLAGAVAHFRAVTRSYWPGLFHTYDVAGLPRTNNDLEHLFGSTRYRERRASGRKGASAALVLRGSVRVLAVVATPLRGLTGDALAPHDLTAWRAVRARLEQRHRSRRAQLRFRRDPAAYLHCLEEQFLKSALPS